MQKKSDVIAIHKKSLKAQMDLRRNWSEKMADRINLSAGSMTFFGIHAMVFLIWIGLNLGVISGLTSFDPFPFGLLTMVVSLEAIFLSIFVLISQNRASKIADLREEVDLKVNVRSEREITRIIKMLDQMQKKMGIKSKNPAELKTMEKNTNLEAMEEEILTEMEEL